jgi:hypothetical protein
MNRLERYEAETYSEVVEAEYELVQGWSSALPQDERTYVLEVCRDILAGSRDGTSVWTVTLRDGES